MTSTSIGKCLVLLAHPDDEIFMLPFLMNMRNEVTFIYFSENSRFVRANRGKELQTSFQRFKKLGYNFQIRPMINTCRDGFCFSDLTREHFSCVDQVINEVGCSTIVTLSLEGGHQDHDVINSFARRIAANHGLRFMQFPSYRKSRNQLFPF